MTEHTADDQNRQFLTTLANLGIATHRLDLIRDAARLHRQHLIGTSELYAVIEADDPTGPPPATAEPLTEVWTVWRDNEPPYGHFAAEDTAKHATIDCWQQTEPSCPDYSWRRDGPRWELLVGGEHGGVYASRYRVHAAPAATTDRAAVCICGHPEQRHFEDACLACDCGDYLEPGAAREVIARWQEAATRKTTNPEDGSTDTGQTAVDSLRRLTAEPPPSPGSTGQTRP